MNADPAAFHRVEKTGPTNEDATAGLVVPVQA
jgi:hypothetical protein